MANVGGVSVLAALLVEEIRARRRTAGASSSTLRHTGRPDAPERTRASSRLTLQQRISARLSAIEASDPDRISKGLHIFLEAVLLEEFGNEVVGDPAFQTLLASVQELMMSSDELVEPIRDAMAELLGPRAQSRQP